MLEFGFKVLFCQHIFGRFPIRKHQNPDFFSPQKIGKLLEGGGYLGGGLFLSLRYFQLSFQ